MPSNLQYQHVARTRSQPVLVKAVSLLTSYATPAIADGEYSRGLDTTVVAPVPFFKSQSALGFVQAILGGTIFDPNPLAVPFIGYALETYFPPTPPTAYGFRLEKTLGYLGYDAPPDAPFIPSYSIMPNLLGMTLTAADLELTSTGFTMGIITNRKHAATAGTVIGQSVAPYSLAPVDVPVNLVVSLGRTIGHHEVIIPDGMSGSTGPIKPS